MLDRASPSEGSQRMSESNRAVDSATRSLRA
jgi:hypothetical protein